MRRQPQHLDIHGCFKSATSADGAARALVNPFGVNLHTSQLTNMDPIPLRKRKSDEPVCGPSRKPDSPVKYESDSSREFDEELLANWNFLETEHISQPSTLSWSDVNIEVAAEEEISTTFGLVPTVSYSRAGLMSLPREILQLIFSHLPLNHLSLNVSLSCKYLYEVINDKEFLKWQKRYCRYRSCKENSLEAFQLTSSYLNAAQIVDVETSVVRAIMSARNFRPEPPTPAVMQIESAWRLHQLAAATLRMLSRPPFTTEDLTEENVCLDTQSGPNLWTKLAGLLLLCDDVASVMQLFRLVSSLAPTEMQSLKEVAYYMATLFTAAYRQFHISSRHSYTLHHSLFLLENSKSPGVKLTSEQMRVVDYRLKPNDLVRIIAYAGTGKTTTLVEYCKNHSDRHFLVLLFNKDACEQVKGKFPPNAQCQTLHSLAYQHVGHRYRQANRTFRNLTINDVLQNSSIRKGLSTFVRAKLVQQTVMNFITSDAAIVTLEHVPDKAMGPDGHPIKVESVYQMEIKEDAQKLWSKLESVHSSLPCPHDVYFKVFQLGKPELYGFDAILVDEAQDCSPTAIDIVLRQKCPKVFVGDPHQQIYSWRGAVNALQVISATKTFRLTQSFRFGPEIAFIANSCVSALENEGSKLLLGVDKPSCLSGVDITATTQVVILCRLNFTLFQQAVAFTQLTSSNLPRIHVIGGLSAIGTTLLWDIYYLFLPPEQRDRPIRDWFLRKFRNFAELIEHANVAQDQELLAKVKIVQFFGLRLPDCIRAIERNHTDFIEEADFVLSTVHRAKGMEFDTVMVGSDLGPENINNVTNLTQKEELNLLYVAITRAKRNLFVNSCVIRQLLYSRCNDTLECLMPASMVIDSSNIWHKMIDASQHFMRLDALRSSKSIGGKEKKEEEKQFFQCVSCQESFEVHHPDDLIWCRKPIAMASATHGIQVRRPGLICVGCATSVEPTSHTFVSSDDKVWTYYFDGFHINNPQLASDWCRWALRPIIAAEQWDPL